MTETLIRATVRCTDERCLAALGYSIGLQPRPYTECELWCESCWRCTSELEHFYLLYEPRLCRYIAYRVSRFVGARTSTVVDDVDQDTMMAIYASWERLREPERVMYTIARRRIYAFCRDYQRNPLEEGEAAEPVDPAALDAFEQVEDRDAVAWALDQLPEKTRDYVLEHKGHGATAEQVAERHGVSPSTVKTLVGRGLPVLAGLLLQMPVVFVFGAGIAELPLGARRVLRDVAMVFCVTLWVVAVSTLMWTAFLSKRLRDHLTKTMRGGR